MTQTTPRDEAFEEEALPHMASVYRFALKLTGEVDRAEDLMQETFLRAYENWDKYTPGTRAKSWLFTLCRNSFLRTEERTRRHAEIVDTESAGQAKGPGDEGSVFRTLGESDPERDFWNRLVDEEIVRAIDALPDDFREVIVLSDLQDLSYEEIAEVVQAPIGTVKSRLFRARRALQGSLYAYAVESGVVRPDGRTDTTDEPRVKK